MSYTHLCSIKQGWASTIWGIYLILNSTQDMGVNYAIPLDSIKHGDELPRETDKPWVIKTCPEKK